MGVGAGYRYDVSGNLVEAPHLSGVEIAPGNKLVKANGGALTYDHRNNVSRDGGATGRELTSTATRSTGCGGSTGSLRRGLQTTTRSGAGRGRRMGRRSTEYFWDTDRLAAELRPGGQLRVYVYADDFSLTPWLAIDYDSASMRSRTAESSTTWSRTSAARRWRRWTRMGGRVWSARLEPYGLARVEARRRGRSSSCRCGWPGSTVMPKRGSAL
jgi:hypothetical protein